MDNNLASLPEYLRRLCRALRPLGIIWSGALSLDGLEDSRLVREMALSGCIGVFVGFETLSRESLVETQKRTPWPEDYGLHIRTFHDHGIQVNGSFVFGFDHDGADVFDRTLEWVEGHRLECATFQVLTPYPGTPLFRRLDAEGRILTRDWSLYDTSHAVFRPQHMSPENLEAGYRRCYAKLFTLASIWRRRPEDWRAVAPYLAMKILYRRANRLWPAVIRRGWIEDLWRPLVAASRWRHLRFRNRLAERVAREQSDDCVVRSPGLRTVVQRHGAGRFDRGPASTVR